jgi:hypothetical protein
MSLSVKYALACVFLASIFSCKKNENESNSTANLVLKLAFDSSQARLNNIGQPSMVGPGRAAQSPIFNKMSVHYIELAPDPFTPLGSGKIIYRAPETTTGGTSAIDFSQSILKGNGEDFISVPLKDFNANTYKYIRVSLSYQNYDVQYKLGAATNTGTVASFIGFNTYITNATIKTLAIPVNANKAQGFWAFESLGTTINGQAPAGATTVPNPLFASSPIPAGSCVVTAAFENATGAITPLYIGGNEQANINIKLSLSTNKSFEWIEVTNDGKWEPTIGENVVDMGIRGLKPIIQ